MKQTLVKIIARKWQICVGLFVFLAITAVVGGVVWTNQKPAAAAVGINEQVNYQGRLLGSTGAIVPDGTYNMEFKIYQDGTGCEAGGSSPCGGTLKWTETRTTTNRVTVKNGYFSVQLGAVTAFGTSVDWNQSVLWLSINIGGTGGSPTWDGEMLPFRRLSSVAYAMNAKQLGGLDASKFVQVAPSAVQVDSGTLSTIFLNKTGASGNILQLQKNGADVFSLGNTGAVAFKGTATNASAFKVDNSNSNIASAINVDTTTTNMVTNPSFETDTSGWTFKGGAALTNPTTQFYSGNRAMQVATTAAIDDGAKFNVALASTTQYTFSIFIRGTATFSNLQIGYSNTGASDTSCATNQTVSSTEWSRISCTFTTGATSGSPNVYLKQTTATARTLFVDAVQLETGATATPYRGSKTAMGGSLFVNGGSSAATASSFALHVNTLVGGSGLRIQGSNDTSLFTSLLSVATNDNVQLVNVNETTNNTQIIGGSSFFNNAALTATAGSAGVRALDVKGAASQTADILNVQTSGGAVLMSVGATGAALFENSTDSAVAFDVQDSGSVPLFRIDTQNDRVYIGNPTGDTVATLLILDTKTSAGDPTGVAGGMYFNEGSFDKMRCYERFWRDCMPSPRTSFSYFSDFLNTTGDNTMVIGAAGGNNTVGTVTAVANHPGILAHGTQASATATAYAVTGATAGILLGNGPWYYESVVRVPTTSTSGERFTYRNGFISSVTGESTNGCFFRYVDNVNVGRWEGVCRAAGTETACNTGVTVTANDWDKLGITVNAAGTSVQFSIDGTNVCGAPITTNIPTAGVGFGSFLIKSIGTTARTYHLDYIDVYSDIATPR